MYCGCSCLGVSRSQQQQLAQLGNNPGGIPPNNTHPRPNILIPPSSPTQQHGDSPPPKPVARRFNPITGLHVDSSPSSSEASSSDNDDSSSGSESSQREQDRSQDLPSSSQSSVQLSLEGKGKTLPVPSGVKLQSVAHQIGQANTTQTGTSNQSAVLSAVQFLPPAVSPPSAAVPTHPSASSTREPSVQSQELVERTDPISGVSSIADSVRIAVQEKIEKKGSEEDEEEESEDDDDFDEDDDSDEDDGEQSFSDDEKQSGKGRCW